MAEIIENDKMCLENRKRLSLTCVSSVDGFSDRVLNITVGSVKLRILGDGIKITSFNKDTGNLTADGNFYEFKYGAKNKSIIKKIFS